MFFTKVQARVADLLIKAIDLPVAREFSAQWVGDVCTQEYIHFDRTSMHSNNCKIISNILH